LDKIIIVIRQYSSLNDYNPHLGWEGKAKEEGWRGVGRIKAGMCRCWLRSP
jgi:hypothetical protein